MSLKYNVAFINPFLHAVVDVLGTMASVQVTPGKPFVNKKRTAQCDVTGLIGISGHADGTIALSLSEAAILRIVSNMIGEEFTSIDDDITDAVGELTNMIAGQARQNLVTLGLKFQASTPSVVVGKGHKVAHPASGPILAIPFSTEEGDLVVEICFTKTQEVDVAADVAEAKEPEASAQEEAKPAAAPEEKMSQDAVDAFFD